MKRRSEKIYQFYDVSQSDYERANGNIRYNFICMIFHTHIDSFDVLKTHASKRVYINRWYVMKYWVYTIYIPE